MGRARSNISAILPSCDEPVRQREREKDRETQRNTERDRQRKSLFSFLVPEESLKCMKHLDAGTARAARIEPRNQTVKIVLPGQKEYRISAMVIKA